MLLLSLLLACAPESAAPSSDRGGAASPPSLAPSLAWARSFWGQPEDLHGDLLVTTRRAEDLAVGPDGAAWLVGNRREPGAVDVPLLLRAEPSGAPGTLHQVVLPEEAAFEVAAVAVSAEGDVLVAGRAEHWVLAMLGEDGTVHAESPWGVVDALPSPGLGDSGPTRLHPLDDGAFLATGPTVGARFVVARIEPSGVLSWTVELPLGDRVGSVAATPDGQVLLTGGDDGSHRIWWRRVDPVTGALGPRVAYGDDGPDRRYALAARLDEHGAVTMLVQVDSPTEHDEWMAFLRWEDEGAEPVVSLLDLDPEDGWHGAAPSSEGTFVVAGHGEDGGEMLCWVHPDVADCLATVDLELPLMSGHVRSLAVGPRDEIYALGYGWADVDIERTWLARVVVEGE